MAAGADARGADVSVQRCDLRFLDYVVSKSDGLAWSDVHLPPPPPLDMHMHAGPSQLWEAPSRCVGGVSIGAVGGAGYARCAGRVQRVKGRDARCAGYRGRRGQCASAARARAGDVARAAQRVDNAAPALEGVRVLVLRPGRRGGTRKAAHPRVAAQRRDARRGPRALVGRARSGAPDGGCGRCAKAACTGASASLQASSAASASQCALPRRCHRGGSHAEARQGLDVGVHA